MTLSPKKAYNGFLFWYQPTVFQRIDLPIDIACQYKRIKALNKFPLLSYVITRIYFWRRTPGVFDMQQVVLDFNSFSLARLTSISSNQS